jgi:hypothetical protein
MRGDDVDLKRVDELIRAAGAVDWTVVYDIAVRAGWLKLSVATDLACPCGGFMQIAPVGGRLGEYANVHDGCSWELRCVSCERRIE